MGQTSTLGANGWDVQTDGEEFVKSKRNKLTGGVKVSAGTKNVYANAIEGLRVDRRPVIVPALQHGHVDFSAGNNQTMQGVYDLPFAWKAYKVRVWNASTSGMTASLVGVATAIDGSNLNSPNGGTFEQVTFSGVAAHNVAAASGSNPPYLWTYLDSDVMYTPSIPTTRGYGAFAFIRQFIPAGTVQKSRMTILQGSPSLATCRQYAAFNTGDCVTTPGSFGTPGASGSFPPVELIGYTTDDIQRILVVGSSTLAGQGDSTSCLGFIYQGSQLASVNQPYQIFNRSQSGNTTINNFTTLLQAIALDGYDAAVYAVYSSNDTDRATTVGMNRQIGQAIRFVDECNARGIRPILCTFQNPTGVTGTELANMRAVNEMARSICNGSNAILLDAELYFSDITAGVGTWKEVANTSDGTHPNAVGHAAFAPTVAAAYQAACE